MKWLRVIAWAILITVTVNLPFFFVWTMNFWQHLGISWSSMPAIKIASVWVLPVVLYWRFAVGTAAQQVPQTLALFVATQVCNVLLVFAVAIVIASAIGVSLAQTFDPQSLLEWPIRQREVIVAVVGYGLARLFPQPLFKRRTLRMLAAENAAR